MKVAKPRTRRKVVRTVSMLLRLNDAGRNGVVTITENGKPTNFHLDRTPSDFGGESFILTKFSGCVREADESDAVYAVQVGPQHSCECRGHLRHGRWTICRHVAAVRALKAAGKLV